METERERRHYEVEPPDSLPRGWAREKMLARIVEPKITDPELSRAALEHATSMIQTSVRIADVAEDLMRQWPAPPPGR